MKTFILVVLSFFLTSCYTSFHSIEHTPRSTVVTYPTYHTSYYYSPYYWNSNRIIYVDYRSPQYYVYKRYQPTTTNVNRTRRVERVRSNGLINRRTNENRSTVRREQPRQNRGTVSRTTSTRKERSSRTNNRNRNNN